MRSILTLTLLTILALFGCGTDEAQTDLAPPAADEGHTTAMGQTGDATQHDMGLNTEITLADDVAAAWKGAVVQVAGPEGETQRYDLPLGETVPLGETGLIATALVFVPDFVMGEDGITTRSAEAANPALRIRIVEEEQPDYEGWLFAAMPEIHPFPHDTYSIVLVGGLPAE